LKIATNLENFSLVNDFLNKNCLQKSNRSRNQGQQISPAGAEIFKEPEPKMENRRLRQL